MGRLSRSRRAWVMPVASFVGGCVALADFLRRGSGVDHTGGALLVVIALALLCIAGLLLAIPRLRGGLRATLLVLSAIDIVGTLAATDLLHTWIVVALTAIACLGWLLLLVPRPSGHGPAEAAA